MLDFPRVVVAELVGEFDLAQRVLIEPVFVALFPGARQLQLIKNAEFHVALSPGGTCLIDCILLCEIHSSIAAVPQLHALLP